MTSTLLGCQHVDLGLELGVRCDRAGLGKNLPTLDLLLVDAPQERTDVVTGDSLVKQLAEHLDTGADRGLGVLEADDLDVVAGVHLALLDTTGDDSAATGDREHVLDGHQERLVDIAVRLGDELVDLVHEVDHLIGCGLVAL